MDAASTASTLDAAAAPRSERGRERAAVADAPKGLRETALRLARYWRGRGWQVVAAVLLFLGSSAIDPVLPALFKWLIDHGFKPQPGFPLALVPVAIIGLFVVRGLLGFGGTCLFNAAAADAVLRLRSDLVQAVLRADAPLFSHLSPGVAASRVISDPQNAVNGVGGAVTSLLRDGTTLVALMGYLFWLNWMLTLASLLTIPLLAFVMRRVQARVLAMAGQSWESQVRLIGIVDDIARAWRVVRTFDATAFERRRFDAEARLLQRTTLRSMVAGAMMTPLTQLVASTGVALIVTLALYDMNRTGGSVGEFVAFVTTLLMTISPMRHLTDIAQPVIGGLVQARACFDLMDTPPEPDHGTHAVETAHGDVRFERVAVTYPGADRPALAGIDLAMHAGETIALVGPSGAGKSTLVSAMLAFVAPSSGRVLFDGRDIGEIRKASLRRQFAVVSQDIVLFDGTIEDNVVYAQPRERGRVDACLRAANLWPFVSSLPEGAATRVGANGTRLSGGQRQRLAIARALYKDAAVWVFDEATSSLDSASEQLVHDAIDRWRGRRTLVLVAHRLSTVRRADRIYVLDEGRVVESGSHDDLIARGGLYAAMVRAQRLG